LDTLNIHSPQWNFFNLAWLTEGTFGSQGAPFWAKYLLRKAESGAIERNIDQLVSALIEIRGNKARRFKMTATNTDFAQAGLIQN
jgi:hypothetical protein